MFQFSEEYMHHRAKLFHWITYHVLVDIMRNITRMMKIKNKNVESDIYREKSKSKPCCLYWATFETKPAIGVGYE